MVILNLQNHTVRKSQILSQKSIFRKSDKIVNLNFLAKNWWFVVIFINKFSIRFCIFATKIVKIQICFWSKSRFLARKFKLFRNILTLIILKYHGFSAFKNSSSEFWILLKLFSRKLNLNFPHFFYLSISNFRHQKSAGITN